MIGISPAAVVREVRTIARKRCVPDSSGLPYRYALVHNQYGALQLEGHALLIFWKGSPYDRNGCIWFTGGVRSRDYARFGTGYFISGYFI
jgi:hypothetical protein